MCLSVSRVFLGGVRGGSHPPPPPWIFFAPLGDLMTPKSNLSFNSSSNTPKFGIILLITVELCSKGMNLSVCIMILGVGGGGGRERKSEI